MKNLVLPCVFFGVGMTCITKLMGIEWFSRDWWLLVIGAACLWASLHNGKDEG